MENILISLGAKIEGRIFNRLFNTSCLRMPGVPASFQLIAFDLKNILISSGSACSSGFSSSFFVMRSMGADKEDMIRISLSPRTTYNDIIVFINAWKEIYHL